LHTGLIKPSNPKIPIMDEELNPEYEAGNLIAQCRCSSLALGVVM
jgi:hypothetical protein